MKNAIFRRRRFRNKLCLQRFGHITLFLTEIIVSVIQSELRTKLNIQYSIDSK